ncbi:MAG: hypothetical protein WCT51_00250 [Candidatus Shapirobacteria bacterium]|jgi:hypothetical protein
MSEKNNMDYNVSIDEFGGYNPSQNENKVETRDEKIAYLNGRKALQKLCQEEIIKSLGGKENLLAKYQFLENYFHHSYELSDDRFSVVDLLKTEDNILSYVPSLKNEEFYLIEDSEFKSISKEIYFSKDNNKTISELLGEFKKDPKNLDMALCPKSNGSETFLLKIAKEKISGQIMPKKKGILYRSIPDKLGWEWGK